MRITFLSPPPNLSGGERVIAIYARELTIRGHDVSVICSRPDKVSLRRWLGGLIRERKWLTKPPLGPSHYENYATNYRVVDHCGPITNSDVPDGDVVVATFWTTSQWACRLYSSKGRKYYLVQGDEGEIHRAAGADLTYRLPLRHVYVSKWIADRIRARHPGADGVVINNAIDTVAFDGGERCMPMEGKFGMMWAGDDVKGGDIAIHAVQLARSHGYDVGLVAFGANEPPERYRREMSSFTLQPNAESLARIYRSCTAWLFTSRFEGFGLPILEAMAARTPVIGTPTGAAPELIGEGGGILVDSFSAEAVANALMKIASMSSQDWKSVSQRAFDTAIQRSWQNATDAFEGFIADN